MNLDLTDEETIALARLLSDTIDGDRYPLSPRIQMLKGILAQIRPEPVREALAAPEALRANPSVRSQKATRRAIARMQPAGAPCQCVGVGPDPLPAARSR